MAALTSVHARRILLAAQGLASEHPPEPGPADVLAAIRRMHALQIDTISVVARSPYLVLWSRIGDYEPKLLDRLLNEHAIFEHWSHAACFLDIADYPVYRRMMLDHRRRWIDRQDAWLDANQAFCDQLLAHIRDNGPVRSADFERPDGQKGNGWWDWKQEKLALELLNTRGDLMIAGRHNFQRIYDLRERILPEWDDSLAPPFEEARRSLIAAVVRSLGVARPEWVAENLHTLNLGHAKNRKRLALEEFTELIPVEVEGWKSPGYIHPDNMPLVEQAATGTLPLHGTTLLSPFDPVTWDRARARELFQFDYTIECYTPAPRRIYGYFTLPILHGDALVGRLDPKAHRKEGILEVKSIHLEPGATLTAELVDGLRDALHRLAAWHNTPELIIRETNPPKLRSALTGRRRSPSPAKSSEPGALATGWGGEAGAGG
ncbi:MAG: winged helix-turn-helix domain-containing protein [Tepidiformaceae bacterium]